MDGHMGQLDDAKALASTFIKTENQEIRIDKLQLETGTEVVRLSSSIGNNEVTHSLNLTEAELLELLNQAVHAGVLPRNFIGKLRDRIEI
jgi:hypothetical protein